MPAKRKKKKTTRAPRRCGVDFLENARERHLTFTKRSQGALKKIAELVKLTDCEAFCVLKFDNGNEDGERKVMTYSSSFDGDWMQDWPDMFIDLLDPYTRVMSVNAGDYDKLWNKKKGGNWSRVSESRWSHGSRIEERKTPEVRANRTAVQEGIRDTLYLTENKMGVQMVWQDPGIENEEQAQKLNSGTFFQPLVYSPSTPPEEEKTEVLPVTDDALFRVLRARNYWTTTAKVSPVKRQHDESVRAKVLQAIPKYPARSFVLRGDALSV